MNSKELSNIAKCSERNIQKRVKKALNKNINFINIKKKIFLFSYVSGVGRGGKIIDFYSQPFETEQEAQAFLNHQANKAQARILQAALGETASPLTSLSATTQPTGETASPLNAFESHLSAPSPLNATAQAFLDHQTKETQERGYITNENIHSLSDHDSGTAIYNTRGNMCSSIREP